MKKGILFILLLFSLVLTYAQDAHSLFEKANTLYRDGHFQKALKKYHAIDSIGLQSADLYFNIGNTYYKLNQIAPSILYFEKALQLDARHGDAQNNLAFAQRMTIDAFESVPKSVFQKFHEQVIYPISYNIWAWISVLFAFLIALFFFGYYFSSYSGRKRLFFTGTILSVFLFLIAISFTIKAKHFSETDQPAIIFSPKVSVKTEPTLKATESFILHEGTKVQILEQVDSWYKIKIIDGKIGWVKDTSLRKIKT